MRIELILLILTAFVVWTIYTDGVYVKRALAAKKYLQMVSVVVAALFLYYLIKKNPLQTKELILTSNEYLKYLPVDSQTTSFISPILDFTAKTTYQPDIQGAGRNRVLKSGTKATKRVVSETKKKFVASRQNWRCGHCDRQLTAWFEVDHKIRLEHGGSNHIDNLVALCRECHGEKTTIENL